MDILRKCVGGFGRLLSIRYEAMVAYKANPPVVIAVGFQECNLHHLLGLGKLSGDYLAGRNRGSLMEDVISGRISYGDLAASPGFCAIEGRLRCLASLEGILDGEWRIFKYNPKRNATSRIKADYLLAAPLGGGTAYVFLARGEGEAMYSCCSVFPMTEKDFTKDQPEQTLLRLDKWRGETLFDRQGAARHAPRKKT